jgi:hypothetical protein
VVPISLYKCLKFLLYVENYEHENGTEVLFDNFHALGKFHITLNFAESQIYEFDWSSNYMKSCNGNWYCINYSITSFGIIFYAVLINFVSIQVGSPWPCKSFNLN